MVVRISAQSEPSQLDMTPDLWKRWMMQGAKLESSSWVLQPPGAGRGQEVHVLGRRPETPPPGAGGSGRLRNMGVVIL